MQDKEKFLQEYLTEYGTPTEPVAHALSYAYLKATAEVTQLQYSNAVGISDRTLRKYIADNQALYDEELEANKREPELDLNSFNKRTLSEDQLDKFVATLYESAINGNARDRQLLIDFTGLQADDLMNLSQVKQRSLRWFIKGELGSINTFLNVRTMGVMLEGSDKLYRGTKESSGNSQAFVDTDLSDEGFKLELMYFGMLFMSLYNSTEHPDLELLSKAVRVNRLENGFKESLNMTEVKQYSRGKNISDVNAPINEEQFAKSLVEIYGAEEAQEIINKLNEAKKTVKTPEVEIEDVKKRASKYEEELTVLASAEEELKHMIRKSKIKQQGEKQ